jgi:hypothetical protein
MCEKIVRTFKAFGITRKDNLPEGKGYEGEVEIQECECGKYFVKSFATGKLIEAKKEEE